MYRPALNRQGEFRFFPRRKELRVGTRQIELSISQLQCLRSTYLLEPCSVKAKSMTLVDQGKGVVKINCLTITNLPPFFRVETFVSQGNHRDAGMST